MSFDRLAPHYRWMEFILTGEKLQRCRLAWLNEVRNCREVLIVGEGPGRFLPLCVRELPAARIVCVDASRAMLDRARASLSRAGGDGQRVEFVHAAVPEWQPPAATFDLIVTHFFLDCFPEPMLTQVVASLARAAKPAARWLVADFQIPPSGVSRLRAKLILALAYQFFRGVTNLPAKRLESPDAALAHHGFRLQGRREFNFGLLRSDLWARE